MTVRSWRDRGIYVMLAGWVVVVLVQATLLPRIRFLGAQPDLLLVLVVISSLFNGVAEGLAFAFLAGLGIDLVAGLPLGATPLALMPVCFLAFIGRHSINVHNLWLPVLLVALATPLQGWLMLFLRSLQGVPVDWAGASSRVILPALVLNVLLTIIVVRLVRQFGGRASVGAVA